MENELERKKLEFNGKSQVYQMEQEILLESKDIYENMRKSYEHLRTSIEKSPTGQPSENARNS